MKTISLLFSAFLVIFGLYESFSNDTILQGAILLMIGTLSFLIISKKTHKIKGYNTKDFMNR